MTLQWASGSRNAERCAELLRAVMYCARVHGANGASEPGTGFHELEFGPL